MPAHKTVTLLRIKETALAPVLTAFLALMMVISTALPAAARAPTPDAPVSFADLVEILSPSVVNISTTQNMGGSSGGMPPMPGFPEGGPFEDFFRDFFERQQRGPNGDGPRQKATSLGSGFVIDAKRGYIVTNNHVIADADEVTVILTDEATLEAEIIGIDKKTDIAVLKVDPSKHPLTEVKFGNSDGSRIGDWVIAIGNPFGLGGSVSAGIISARARDINSGPYDDYLQTDAAINRGNSGGPLFNMNGEVVGINTAIFSPTGGSVGIGFAIPSNLANVVVDQLIEFGRTKRGWLGVRIQDVTDDVAESLGLDQSSGALIADVTEGGPADVAGIRAGDVILTFDGRKVPDMRRLPRIVAETRIDRVVDVEIWSEGKPKTVKVKVAELEQAEADGLISLGSADREEEEGDDGKRTTLSDLGLTLGELTDSQREKLGLGEDAKGVVILGVDDKSGAAQADKGVREGDLVLEVNQKPVASPDEMSKVLEDASNHGKRSAMLLINRRGDNVFAFIPLR